MTVYMSLAQQLYYAVTNHVLRASGFGPNSIGWHIHEPGERSIGTNPLAPDLCSCTYYVVHKPTPVHDCVPGLAGSLLIDTMLSHDDKVSYYS